MDKDPGWVREKYYTHVECVEGVWYRQRLTIDTLARCSIHPMKAQLQEYEASQGFLDAMFEVGGMGEGGEGREPGRKKCRGWVGGC
jgi:hypothetical protein